MARLSYIPTLTAATFTALTALGGLTGRGTGLASRVHIRMLVLATLAATITTGCTSRSGLTGASADGTEDSSGDTDPDTVPNTDTGTDTGTDSDDASGGSDESGTCGSLTGIDGDSAGGDTGGEDCDSFLGCMDVACLTIMCDWWAQDCGAGKKCGAIASTPGSGSWDANVCMSVGCEPPGAPCMKVDDPAPCASQTDTCDATSICMDVDADTGIGTCVEMCTGTPDDPACPVSGQTCRQLFSGVLNVCLPDCNPLLPGACAPGLACVPEVADDSVAGFVCLDDYGGPLSGESCSWGACAAGHMCIDAASFGPGCDGNDCCTEFCDLTDAAFTCAGQDQQCVALFDPADPLYGNVGRCQLTM